jgi:hypothetical protein
MADEKEVEYYAAKANAWFNTNLEYDKSLLMLSAGAIGLLVTLLTTVGVDSITLLFIFFGAVISFVICLFSVLAIFSRNAKHLEDLIAGKRGNDQLLGFLDTLSIISFVVGVLLAAIIGLATSTSILLSKEVTMSEKNNSNQSTVPLRDSFNKAENNATQPSDMIKSFNGAQNVAPPQSGGSSSSTSDGSSQGSGSTGETKK